MGNSTAVLDRPGRVAARKGRAQRMTEEEFVAWCTDDGRAEWVGGKVQVIPPMNLEHSTLFGFLSCILGIYVEDRELGEAGGPKFQVRLRKIPSRRLPDLMFVRNGRLDLFRYDYLAGAPDLIVEIVSPESATRDWREKYREYQAAGVREYWIVDPMAKRVEAYTLGAAKRYRRIPEAQGVIRSKVVRGFFVKTAWLWQEPRPKVHAVLKELGVL